MSYKITASTSFKKGMKKFLRIPEKRQAIMAVVELLTEGGVSSIPERMVPHKLKGDYKGCWECHVMPDLLLIWVQDEKPEKEIVLVDIGSHSELF